MASTSKCEYCGSTVRSDQQQCPNCGATNPLYVVDTPRTIFRPKTIEELQEYCAERGMPLLRMRFFIGQDYKRPKAFGIFKDADGKVTVYKNKANGERAIRYSGYDEETAVQELFAKLLDECHNRGIYPDSAVEGEHVPSRNNSTGNNKVGCLTLVKIWFMVMFVAPMIFFAIVFAPGLLTKFVHPIAGVLALIGTTCIGLWLARKLVKHEEDRTGAVNKKFRVVTVIVALILTLVIPGVEAISLVQDYKHPDGYYHYNNATYYKIDSSWYKYNTTSHSWDDYTYGSSEIYDSGRDYYEGSGWDSDWGDTTYEFKNSSAYSEYKDTHKSSSSSSSSSSYDSWDSGGTDWDSDW